MKAVPAIAKRVVTDLNAHDALVVDPEPFRVRGLGTLVKDGCSDWHRFLSAAARTRRNLGAVLLVLDGDIDRVSPQWRRYTTHFGAADFCAYRVAAMLGEEARAVRAGEQFSLASVFAMKEFEAWLLAGLGSLRGKPLAEGRGHVPADATCPPIEIERTRSPKDHLKRIVKIYQQSLDQGVLAKEVDLQMVKSSCRSFVRFYSAIQKLAEAVRSEQHIITPKLSMQP